MAGRSPLEAFDNFTDPLQRAISCVCDAVLITSGYQVRDEPNGVRLSGDPVQLQGDRRLLLSVRHPYRIIETIDPGGPGPWRATTAGYLYAIEKADGQEIVAYHWHPRADITFPHVHLGPGARVGFEPLITAHLPTGRVILEDVLRLAIMALGVRPRREDWSAVLDETQAAYEGYRA